MNLFRKYFSGLLLVNIFAVTNVLALTSQEITITTPAPVNAAINSSFIVYATASSDMTVSISSSGGCSGEGAGGAFIQMTSVTVDCVVRYEQSGDSEYEAAPTLSSTTSATKISQTISFPQPSNVMLHAAPFLVAASASSGLSTVIVSETPSLCSVDMNGQVDILASGQCVITASQDGDNTYAQATPVSRTILISKTLQSVQVKYIWIEGETGKFRFSTVPAPPETDACFSNYGQFISGSADLLALLVDAKLTSKFVDLTYISRQQQGACDAQPDGSDEVLAAVSGVSLRSDLPSILPAESISGYIGSPHSRLTGVELNWFWVDGNDGYVRALASTALPPNACSGFLFDGKTDAGRKMFSMMAAAKINTQGGNTAPLTIWYSSSGNCGTGDASLVPVYNVGLMY